MNGPHVVVVRPMVPADVEQVLAFCERLHRGEAISRFDAVWKREWLLSFMATASNLSVVACRPRLVGYLLAEAREEEWSRTRHLHVREIFVEEGSRLLGCGTALMQEASVQAERWHCAYLSIDVREGNLSSSFFNGLGFSAFSTEYRAKP
jgi:ribosomal protein S18 acetylase RimI-like enzyme